MIDVVSYLSDVLTEKIDITEAIDQVKDTINNKHKISKSICIWRALNSLLEKKYLDFCGHIRQTMIIYKTNFELTPKLYDILFKYKDMFGFIFLLDNYIITVDPIMLSDIPDLVSSYSHEIKRVVKPSLGDGRLYKYYRYTEYKSLSQKMLMYFIANMKESETILACLPTGGGKSLSWQLPGISDSYNGLIIVVVPTVSLAIDHERRSKEEFDKLLAANSYPLAYYSGTSQEKKQQIFSEIDAGTLPILYISPEALQGNSFKEKIFEAATKGRVSALVIDEAHLIANWGIHFRPEFQLLSSFRNNLKSICKDGLKTVLLSATLTQDDTDTIKNIFCDENFTEFRADELRPEPSYYIHACKDEDERIEIMRKLVSIVPRPIIIYTVSPDQAKLYYYEICKLGYKNIEMFTGKTNDDKREKIIKEWNDNNIDIIIATSAFGMGVDKADIRTIITAYTPESVSRYYQEVGRAGRDGYSSLNYFLPCNEIDSNYVKSLTKGMVLTAENIVARWKILLETSIREDSNKIWIDINSPPEHLRFVPTGRKNLGWNKSVVLTLCRAGLLEITDVKIKNNLDYSILVHLKNIPLLENLSNLEKFISVYRENERRNIESGITEVNNLIKSPNKKCFSSCFINEFPNAKEVCSGCPYCRKLGLSEFHNKGVIQINSTKKKLHNEYEQNGNDMFNTFLYSSKNLLLSIKNLSSSETLINCIELLVKNNVNLIITPNIFNQVELLSSLSLHDKYNYILLTIDEISNIDTKWLGGVCAAIYTDDDEYNDKLYNLTRNILKQCNENKIIHIANFDLVINYEGRLLSELCDNNLIGNQFFEEGVTI